MAEAGETVAEFVSALRAVTADSAEPKEIIKQVAPLAKAMAAKKDWIQPEFYECDTDQGFGITILNEDDGHNLLVEAIAWLPGRGVAPHDHQTWGVVVGLDGHETNVNWLRQDDGSRPGFADIAVSHENVVGPGDVVAFLPDDIHSVRNDDDVTTLSLHIYGKTPSALDRSEFDPEAKVQRPCPKRVRRRV